MMEKNNLPIDEDIILRGYYEEALAYSECVQCYQVE